MGVSRIQMRHDLIDLEHQVKVLIKSIKRMDAMIEICQEDIEAHEARNMQRERRTATSYAEMARLRRELYSKNQRDLSNDIIMIHVPEDLGIPLLQVVVRVAKWFGVKLKKRDVVSAIRIEPPRRPSRPIVVRLANYVHRAALLNASRCKRNVCNDAVILHKVHIYERLTRRNEILLQKTRDVAKVAGWLHVWVVNAEIFVRCALGDDRVHIRHLRDLHDLCESKAPQLLETSSDEDQDDGEDSDSTTSSTAFN